MKKIFLSFLAVVFALSLASCTQTCTHLDEDNDLVCDLCLQVLEQKTECTEHVDLDKDGLCDVCSEELDPYLPECTKHVDENKDGLCDQCGAQVEVIEPSIKDDFNCITIAQAIELAREAGGAGTSEKYYIYGKITEVSNATYGSMTIEDETGSIYVYGVYGSDQTTRYDALEDRPVVGDEVVLYGILKTYNDTPELDRGYLQALKHNKVDVDDSDYPEEVMSIASVRDLEKGELVRISGVVAQITYANGMKPNGFYLVDETGSIYVYGGDATAQVREGNKVTLIGEKTYYVLETEQYSADKYGYKGCNQIQKATVVENDNQVNAWNKTWVEETTIKDIMDTPATIDITTSIYKVNALVKKVEGTGFTNYYFDDLDGVTGSYTYTSCSGADFTWLDEFDGKICTVYLSVINAKSTSAGCIWRFLPIEVIDEGYKFDQSKGAEFVAKYYIKDQFLDKYESDPTLELLTSVSNELIGIENATISYTSDNEEVVYFETVDGKVVMHTKGDGTATVVATVNYNGQEAEASVTINVSTPIEYEYISVQEAIASADGTEVILRGIVASSLVNQSGFYLIDETGVIAVVAPEAEVSLLSSGDEVVIKGTKTHRIKEGYMGAGQINIDNATILVNYYGNHEYSTSTFDNTKTLADLYAFSHLDEHTTEVYVVDAIVDVVETPYYTSIKIKSIDGSISFNLYSSSANQYQFLKQYNGKVVSLELAICNWNSKDYYSGCVISATYEGVKTVNTLNFAE